MCFTGVGLSPNALPHRRPTARCVYRLRRLAALRTGTRRPRPTFSTASQARRAPLFSQPDDILLLSRELPPLALAWSFSRARFESWYSDCRSFSVTATRPRPPDEMGCQDGRHLGFGGCARNFCGCRHCFFLLRAGVGASLLLAFKTFHASVLRP